MCGHVDFMCGSACWLSRARAAVEAQGPAQRACWSWLYVTTSEECFQSSPQHSACSLRYQCQIGAHQIPSSPTHSNRPYPSCSSGHICKHLDLEQLHGLSCQNGPGHYHISRSSISICDPCHDSLELFLPPYQVHDLDWRLYQLSTIQVLPFFQRQGQWHGTCRTASSPVAKLQGRTGLC